MAKCKNCGTEEQGYGTLLDKRGYCYKPDCQSCSHNEVEQQNTCLQAQLDREIHINRKMKNALEKYADLKNWRCDTITGFQSVWQGGVDDEQTGNITAQDVLKEVGEEE